MEATIKILVNYMGDDYRVEYTYEDIVDVLQLGNEISNQKELMMLTINLNNK